jgi:hypothetical protein
MKYATLIALISLAGSAAAEPNAGNWRERRFLPSPINSVGLHGNPANVTVVGRFRGEYTDETGSPQLYDIRAIGFEGILTVLNSGSFPREAVIRVQPPDGAPVFYIQPLLEGSIPATSLPLSSRFHVAVPVSEIVGTGDTANWLFTFEESFDDAPGTGVDAVWEQAIVYAYDIAPATPAPNPNVSSISLAGPLFSNGSATAPSVSNSLVLVTPEGPFNAFRIWGQVTALSNGTVNSSETLTSEVRVRVTPPNGVPITVSPVVAAVNGRSTTNVDVTVPYLGQPSGTWNIALFESVDFPGVNDNIWNSFRLELAIVPPPASAIAMGTLSSGTPNFENMTAVRDRSPTALQWFTFTTTVPAAPSSGFYVDLDTIGTTTSGLVTDTEIAVYSSRGVKLAEDDDDGPDAWSMLSFGSPLFRPSPTLPATPPATTTSLTRNGGDGQLPPGTYYVAHTNFNAVFDPVFNVATPTATTIRQLNIRTNMFLVPPSSPCGPADLGGEGGSEGFDSILDNNDFIVFINFFFGGDGRADLGSEGGAAGSDGLFDNNDFIVFIQEFFAGGGNPGCNGMP